MPYLAREQVASLLRYATSRSADDMLCIALNGFAVCCDVGTPRDYCRTCDEFYRLHLPGCVFYHPRHEGHRLTIVPFVEERTPLDGLVDLLRAAHPSYTATEAYNIVVEEVTRRLDEKARSGEPRAED